VAIQSSGHTKDIQKERPVSASAAKPAHR